MAREAIVWQSYPSAYAVTSPAGGASSCQNTQPLLEQPHLWDLHHFMGLYRSCRAPFYQKDISSIEYRKNLGKTRIQSYRKRANGPRLSEIPVKQGQSEAREALFSSVFLTHIIAQFSY